jgi:hypothetical protein
MGSKSLNIKGEVEQFDTVKAARLRASIEELEKQLAIQKTLLEAITKYPEIEPYLSN